MRYKTRQSGKLVRFTRAIGYLQTRLRYLVVVLFIVTVTGISLLYPRTVAATLESATAYPALLAATRPSSQSIDAYLASKDSPLAGWGAVFMTKGEQYNVDPRLIIAIAGAESSFGKSTCQGTPASTLHNAWGMLQPSGENSICRDYASWEVGIDAVAWEIGAGGFYFKGGRTTIEAIGGKYCGSGCENWVGNVRSFFLEQGGDTENLHFTGAPAQDRLHLPLMYWPLDDNHRTITSYPNTPWTWERLGLNPGKQCPPFPSQHSPDTIKEYWRGDPSIPEAVDRAQAMPGGRFVGCYSKGGRIAQDHEGTDIYAEAGIPVYAAAAGTVADVNTGCDNNCRILINHSAVVGDETFTWRVRYVHLNSHPQVSVGASVQPGDLIGYTGKMNHLHFEVENLQGKCEGTCITNPWGERNHPNWPGKEIYLWIDRNYDGLPDVPSQNGCADSAGYVAQAQYPTVGPGQTFQIYFEVRNTGTCTWSPTDGYQLVHVDGPSFGAASNHPIQTTVEPGQTVLWPLNMRAPNNVTPGESEATHWRPAKGDTVIGNTMWISVTYGAASSGGLTYVYRPSPNGYVCGTDGPSPNIVDLRLSPRNHLQSVEARIGKCDGTKFQLGGKVYLDLNGVETWGPIHYSAGDSRIDILINPVLQGIFGANEYQARVYSDDQPTTPKHTGRIVGYEVYDPPAQIPSAHAYYEVSDNNARCGTTGPSPGIVQLALQPDDANNGLVAVVRKCDGTNFQLGGKVYLLVDGKSNWGPYSITAQDSELRIPFSPSSRDLVGFHSYMAWVYSDDQPTLAKHTGAVTAWERMPAGQDFVDVSTDHWAYDAIQALYQSGLTKGATSCRPPGDQRLYFCPDQLLDRAHLVVFILRHKYGADFSPSGPYRGTFSDVPANHSWALWIEQAYEDGLTQGSTQCAGSGLRFCPESPATRDHITRFLSRVEAWPQNGVEDIFSDLDQADTELASAAEYMWWRGFTNGSTGCPGDSLRYCPDESLRRAHAAAFLARVLGLIDVQPRCVSLIVDARPAGAGDVVTGGGNCPITSALLGIAEHSTAASSRLFLYRVGTQVAVDASPLADGTFLNWSGDIWGSGNRIVVPMESSRLVIANFSPGFELLSQSIIFDGLPSRRLGESPFSLHATATSGLPVSYSSSTPGSCSLAGGRVTLIAVGTCTIVATQPGDNVYAAAAAVTRSFSISEPSVDDEGEYIYLPQLSR